MLKRCFEFPVERVSLCSLQIISLKLVWRFRYCYRMCPCSAIELWFSSQYVTFLLVFSVRTEHQPGRCCGVRLEGRSRLLLASGMLLVCHVQRTARWLNVLLPRLPYLLWKASRRTVEATMLSLWWGNYVFYFACVFACLLISFMKNDAFFNSSEIDTLISKAIICREQSEILSTGNSKHLSSIVYLQFPVERVSLCSLQLIALKLMCQFCYSYKISPCLGHYLFMDPSRMFFNS